MQPTQPNSPAPDTFWAQSFWRIFEQKTPAFHALIRKYSFWLTGLSIVVPWIVSKVLPDMGVDVPQWLTYTNSLVGQISGFLAGLGIGGVGVSSTVIKGAAPPLQTDTPVLSLDGLAAKMAEQEARLLQQQGEITRLKQGPYFPPQPLQP